MPFRKNKKRKQYKNTHNEPKYIAGPVRRDQMLAELQQETTERISRIENDFANGFKKISQYNDTVTIFGSARFTHTHPYYKKAEQLAAKLAEEGYTVVTGGGGGIMEAGNRGAYEAKGNSIGLNIELPQEQTLNPYTTDSVAFRYFFSRKVLLAYAAQAYIFFPGGFGTLDEFFEIITLIQTKKTEPAPVILVGNEYWKSLDKFIEKELIKTYRSIHASDRKIYTITEDEDKIMEILSSHERAQVTSVFNR